MTSERSAPEQLLFTQEHEWVDVNDGMATLGITPYAATKLGDIVYVDLPSVGASFSSGDVLGEIESTKSVGELYAPFDGTVVAVNAAIEDSPALVNSDPFGEGWLVTVEFSDKPDLLSFDEYSALTGEG